tara:strand:- start:78978 stop:79124 length:147 start_codon:yes stop_codon:yes gene_type:complete
MPLVKIEFKNQALEQQVKTTTQRKLVNFQLTKSQKILIKLELNLLWWA